MPLIGVNGTNLHYVLDGPERAPVIAFSNSLGTNLDMWNAQVRALGDRFRCLRYDTRGHGASATQDVPITIDTLATDLRALLDALGIGRAHIVGLSLGGMTAQAFAAAHPERVDRLVLMATAAAIGPAAAWEERAARARRDGMGALVDMVIGRWFTAGFAGAPEIDAVRRQMSATDPTGYARACEAIRDADLSPRLGHVTAPTLVLVGAEDPATPPALAEALRLGIPDAELVVIPRAAHLLNVERSERINGHLAAFLGATETARPALSSSAGLARRRAVLGETHVARARAAAGAFGAPWQDFITRYAWGEIWDDPTLSAKSRSLITLALMVALNREDEFKLHIGPALRHGVTPDELRALLKQTAVYAGVPAANNAFKWAISELESLPEIPSRAS